MAVIKCCTVVENLEADSPAKEVTSRHLEGNLSDIEADVSDLMAPGTQSLRVSLVTQSLIYFYILKGYFKEGDCRPPGDEETPVPRDDEINVFRDFFIARTRFPLDSVLPDLLLPFNVKLHHLTPNAIVQLSKFFWVARTFRGPLSIDTFCHFYEFHPQSC
jgi:hypothetical protein